MRRDSFIDFGAIDKLLSLTYKLTSTVEISIFCTGQAVTVSHFAYLSFSVGLLVGL